MYGFCRFFAIYWRAFLSVVIPVLYLPICLLHNTPDFRCLYVVCLMATFWMTEALPVPITAMFPMVLFPLMGIMDSNTTIMTYFKETNMMFIGGVIIAIAIEHCNLHRRIALYAMLVIGCTPRKLSFGLALITMFISFWIANTAATAMMCPIILASLTELESKGVGMVYVKRTTIDPETGIMKPIKDEDDYENRQPSRTTIGFFLMAAYASSLGGLGTVVGSGTNLAIKGIYETRFHGDPEGVSFIKWMMFNIPVVMVSTFFTWLYIQIVFMGMFRPNSEDAAVNRVGPEAETAVKDMIKNTLKDLGPMTFHEIGVIFCFALAIILWFFRQPQFIPGWPTLITKLKVGDAVPVVLVILLLFYIPARPEFFRVCNKDETTRPKSASPGLITWNVLQQRVPWGLMFLLGGGFALSAGAAKSGMSKLIADALKDLETLPNILVLVMCCCMASLFTEVGVNVAIANILLPVLAEMSVNLKYHPLFLMMPVGISCSHSFLLPVSTPPNAVAAFACNMPVTAMMKIGVVISIICQIILIPSWLTLGRVIYNYDKAPAWLK